MGGWMDGWIDGWMDGQMDGWVDGWTDGRTDGWMDGQTDGRMDRWTDGWRDGLLLHPWPIPSFCVPHPFTYSRLCLKSSFSLLHCPAPSLYQTIPFST